MSKPKKGVVVGNCSYCNRVQEMEPEHVVPQSIFVDKNQAKIVIDACHDCNHRKGRGEGDLRDYLIIRVGVDGHPDIRPLMDEMAESYGRGSSKIAKAADEERKLTVRRRKSGILERAYKVPLPDPIPMELSVRYMVRGLYFFETGKRYQRGMPLNMSWVDDEDFEETVDQMMSLAPYGFRPALGNDVFKYVPIGLAEGSNVIAWLMVFFGKVAIIGRTGDEEDDDAPTLTFDQKIRRRGNQEKRLRGIVNRELIKPPPDDMLGFLRWHEERKKKTPPG
jgi:hypothetical protein